MAFGAGSFMEKFETSVQIQGKIVAEKERRITMASAANMAGTDVTMSAQPEVDAASTTYHQEGAMEEQQEGETVNPNMMTAKLFTAVELI